MGNFYYNEINRGAVNFSFKLLPRIYNIYYIVSQLNTAVRPCPLKTQQINWSTLSCGMYYNLKLYEKADFLYVIRKLFITLGTYRYCHKQDQCPPWRGSISHKYLLIIQYPAHYPATTLRCKTENSGAVLWILFLPNIQKLCINVWGSLWFSVPFCIWSCVTTLLFVANMKGQSVQ